MPGREIRSAGSPSPLHQREQLFDVGDRRVLKNAVAQVEDVRATSECVKDALDRRAQSLAAREQRQWVEVALERQPLGQMLRCPCRIDRLVQTECGDSRLPRVSAD